jgi:hypothetical protein
MSSTIAVTMEKGNGQYVACATFACAPGGIRTPDLEIRSLLLYPAELRALRDKRTVPGSRCGATSDSHETRSMSRAIPAAWTRLDTPSLARMWET